MRITAVHRALKKNFPTSTISWKDIWCWRWNIYYYFLESSLNILQGVLGFLVWVFYWRVKWNAIGWNLWKLVKLIFKLSNYDECENIKELTRYRSQQIICFLNKNFNVCIEHKETKTRDASAEISCDFAAQWDALSGTISCGANCSVDAVLDGNRQLP